MQSLGGAETAPPSPRPIAEPHSATVSGQKCFNIKRVLALGSWLGACLLASYAAMGYDFQPGGLGQAPTDWPADTGIERSADAVTVLAFLHPRCPCTRATVKNLIDA